jgi:hypothetical protein
MNLSRVTRVANLKPVAAESPGIGSIPLQKVSVASHAVRPKRRFDFEEDSR